MKIYVDELPKDCSECPMRRNGNLKLQQKGRYVEAQQCVFGQYKYQTIDDEIDTCPLKLLSNRLADERKKVIDLVRENYVKYDGYDDFDWMGFTEFLNEIERGK